MRKVLLTAILGLTLAACKEQTPSKPDRPAEAMKSETRNTATTNADPVCEMAYDTSWTESTVYQNDTIRFCSEQCKNAFIARPAKYAKH